MSNPTSPSITTAPYPEYANAISAHQTNIQASPPLSNSSSISSSSEIESNLDYKLSTRRSRLERPRMMDRQRSNSIIIPKGEDMFQREKPNYPPDDARAMSPRRSSYDIDQLEQSARKALKDHARTLQSSIAALAERIDEVKSDHDKLESENKFLQDYIGRVTRTMSRDGISRSASTKKGKH